MSIDSEELLTCPARITLDAGQLAFLDGLPVGAPSLQSELGCELELGHGGSHAALAQHVEATMWWIQWTLSASEINPYTWCPARQRSGGSNRDEKDCTLFSGHPGGHSSAKRYWHDNEEN